MDYWHRNWVCPFYSANEMLYLHCEGGNRLKFPTPAAAKDYIKRYCCDMGGYPSCSIAAMLLKHYEETEK